MRGKFYSSLISKECPTAVRCFEEDFEACVAHLKCPPKHRRFVRTTNLLERLFVEERRRVKAAGMVFGERAVLKLMYAATIRASETWRGIKVSGFELAQPERIGKQLAEQVRRENQPATQPGSAQKDRIYSKSRT